ncbi:transcriptional regulator [Xenorhabdus vietnamensis]|uniref:Transcriptional regulator n=1 Tax=Xenorhabdus vietnamensis TaxID=351656 RepID=A0A1Y2S9D9_9GAMM|nr:MULTISPECIES: hypothetical protein [Xenorhabdus]OTA14151.1 transcriptional regulator [Xenorhabdus vietnamensis]
MDKKLFNNLVESMNQMVAIEKGELAIPDKNIHHQCLSDIKNLSEFTETVGNSISLIQSEELSGTKR